MIPVPRAVHEHHVARRSEPDHATGLTVDHEFPSGGEHTAVYDVHEPELATFSWGHGFTFTVPADTTTRVLRVYVGGSNMRGQIVALKKNVDEAITKTSRIKTVVVLKRTGQSINMQQGRDVWWHDAIAGQTTNCPAEQMDAEDLLFVLYTSGSTGKPKGIIHTTGGYMVGTYITTHCTT